MRRQTLFSGLDPAWAAGDLRLDPKDLPARIAVTGDAGCPGTRAPTAVIDHNAVILSQAANGPVLSVPVRSYEAVLLAANAAGDGKAGIVLFHQNEDLSVPLCIANDFDTLREDWQLWGETLDKPLARATDVRVPGQPGIAPGRLAGLPAARAPRQQLLRGPAAGLPDQAPDRQPRMHPHPAARSGDHRARLTPGPIGKDHPCTARRSCGAPARSLIV